LRTSIRILAINQQPGTTDRLLSFTPGICIERTLQNRRLRGGSELSSWWVRQCGAADLGTLEYSTFVGHNFFWGLDFRHAASLKPELLQNGRTRLQTPAADFGCIEGKAICPRQVSREKFNDSPPRARSGKSFTSRSPILRQAAVNQRAGATVRRAGFSAGDHFDGGDPSRARRGRKKLTRRLRLSTASAQGSMPQ
jgi:hypothetical protein